MGKECFGATDKGLARNPKALRVFRAATAAARAATAEGAGVPEYLALAAALTRLGPGDDDGGETAALLAGGLGLAAAAFSWSACSLSHAMVMTAMRAVKLPSAKAVAWAASK